MREAVLVIKDTDFSIRSEVSRFYGAFKIELIIDNKRYGEFLNVSPPEDIINPAHKERIINNITEYIFEKFKPIILEEIKKSITISYLNTEKGEIKL
jgi:hypothetical protein